MYMCTLCSRLICPLWFTLLLINISSGRRSFQFLTSVLAHHLFSSSSTTVELCVKFRSCRENQYREGHEYTASDFDGLKLLEVGGRGFASLRCCSFDSISDETIYRNGSDHATCW